MFHAVELRLRTRVRRTLAAGLCAAVVGLGGSSAMTQDRSGMGQTLNDLFIAIYSNSGVMNGLFENCASIPGAAGEFFSAVHKRYVRNDSVIAGMILSVHRKVMDRQVATGSPTSVENLANNTRDYAYSEIKRKFIVANANPDLERRLCDDLMQRFRTGEWDNPRFVNKYFEILERFDPRIYAEFYDMKAVLDDRRSGKLKTGTLPKQKKQ